jgi:hypothetical protein
MPTRKQASPYLYKTDDFTTCTKNEHYMGIATLAALCVQNMSGMRSAHFLNGLAK